MNPVNKTSTLHLTREILLHRLYIPSQFNPENKKKNKWNKGRNNGRGTSKRGGGVILVFLLVLILLQVQTLNNKHSLQEF